MEPMQQDFLCAYCYKPGATQCCGKCGKRRYCSRECQKQDWTTSKQRTTAGHHKHFCGKAGEINVDWEIRSAGRKGLGVFAKRDFAKNEIIIAERPALRHPKTSFLLTNVDRLVSNLPEGMQHAIQILHPTPGTLAGKARKNYMSCTNDEEDKFGDGESGLFIHMSRVNHDCLPNTSHYFFENRGSRILVSSRNIAVGEEVTISYVGWQKYESRQHILQTFYDINCSCSACNDPKVRNDMDKMRELDESILHLGSMGRVPLALQKANVLLKLYDKYSVTSWLYHRTYYDMFQVAITRRQSLQQAKSYIQKSYEHCRAYTSDEENDSTQRMKSFVDAPNSHRNYLLLG